MRLTERGRGRLGKKELLNQKIMREINRDIRRVKTQDWLGMGCGPHVSHKTVQKVSPNINLPIALTVILISIMLAPTSS